jgi:hypothetical protein
MFFFVSSLFCKIQEQEVEQILPRVESWHQWEGGGGRERGQEDEYGAKDVYTCM